MNLNQRSKESLSLCLNDIFHVELGETPFYMQQVTKANEKRVKTRQHNRLKKLLDFLLILKNIFCIITDDLTTFFSCDVDFFGLNLPLIFLISPAHISL